MSSTPTILATSQLQRSSSKPVDNRAQTVFKAGNGRYFASVRADGRTQFLGTFGDAQSAQRSVDSFVSTSGARLQQNFQFY